MQMCLTLRWFSVLLVSASAGLTWLVLFGASDMDDVGAVAIASWLRQLRNLQLATVA
jgi:hypothetical protein